MTETIADLAGCYKRDTPALAGRLFLGKHQPDRVAGLHGGDDRLDFLAGHGAGEVLDLAGVAVAGGDLQGRGAGLRPVDIETPGYCLS